MWQRALAPDGPWQDVPAGAVPHKVARRWHRATCGYLIWPRYDFRAGAAGPLYYYRRTGA